MAIYETTLKANFNDLLSFLETEIMRGSLSASFVDGSTTKGDGMNYALRVYERYSALGKNRLSLTISILDFEGDIKVSFITSGGSQGVFLKINTFGESNFLAQAEGFINEYKSHLKSL